MPNRVVLGNYGGFTGLNISLPGYEVLNFNPAQMAFSTDWSHAGMIHASGLVGSGGTAYFADMPYVPAAYVSIAYNENSVSTICTCRGVQYDLTDPNTHRYIGTVYDNESLLVTPYYIVGSNYISIFTADSNYSQPGYTAKFYIFNAPGGG